MRRARGLVRLVSPLAIALVVLGGQHALHASAPAGSDPAGGKKKQSGGKPDGRPNNNKGSAKSKVSPGSKVTRSKPSTLSARQKLAHAQSGKSDRSGTINENVTLTPFPSHAGAARKALSQNRRDQLEDAERAARAPEQAERWQTVLFHLRDLDARADSEGCFWCWVSSYRLGQIERARSLRQGCELAAKDGGIIEAEDEQAARLQAAGTVAETGPAPVGNLAPYAGDAPAKIER
jgi:hypothetical protein